MYKLGQEDENELCLVILQVCAYEYMLYNLDIATSEKNRRLFTKHVILSINNAIKIEMCEHFWTCRNRNKRHPFLVF